MRRSVSFAGVFLAASVAAASDNSGYSMNVVVDGAPAVEYAARGRIYVEALRGREFTVRLHNPGPGRAAVALSVDGRNVIDARRTSAGEAAKWVIGSGETLEIPGWQISGSTSRRFFFTETERSYAKWLGDTSNVGTIEAVFYREKDSPIAARPRAKDERDEVRERQAPSDVGDGVAGGASSDSSTLQSEIRAEAPSGKSSRPAPKSAPSPRNEADRFAATGIGGRTGFSVEWVAIDLDERPAARVSLRYEFREQLVRLGVLPREGRELFAREHARGFEPAYAPDPGGQR